MMFPRFLRLKALWCRVVKHRIWSEDGLSCVRCQRRFTWTRDGVPHMVSRRAAP